MPKRSNLEFLSIALLAMVFLLLSCASGPQPDHLIVHVPPRLSAPLHIVTCVEGASAGEVTVDEQGIAKTALCPDQSHTVEIEVIARDTRYRLSVSEVHIRRTGDGIATSIEAQPRN